jgi:glutathione synthase/RimK-type ligase-like ATP-grasp enzyme
MKVAIHQNKKKFDHSTGWDKPWIKYCEENNIPYETVDCFQPDIINNLKEFDCLLWHFNNYSYSDMLFAQSILYSAKQMGLKVFPDFPDAWHFDNKIAETYVLQSVNAPIPQSYIFHLYDNVKQWVNGNGFEFPIVAKLKSGSGSHNVKLLQSKNELLSYAKRMFGRGFSPHPSIFYKAKSNYNSSKGNKDLIKSRIKRIPEFYRTYKNARKFPNEKEYAFFQEFIPNNGYDLKIVVVGDKLGFIARHTRKNDFRASGGGDIYFDTSLITKNIIDSAFDTSDKLGFQCMGYDYVVDTKTDKGKIVEMSYGFSHTALLQANGYFDRAGIWHDDPLNAPEEIVRNMLGNH